MKRSLRMAALMLALGASAAGCNESGGARTPGATTTTERQKTTTEYTTGSPTPESGSVRVDAGPSGATATGRTAANGRDNVDVEVAPGGGVNVDVQGEPIRERIRERRAARDANLPR